MTSAEHDARRDLLRNAEHLRKAMRETKDKSAALRLGVGACVLEQTAAFIYWRNERRKAA